MKLLALFFAVIALFSAVAATQDEKPKDPVVVAYQDLIAKDMRLATVGYHLAKGSADYCRNIWRNPGWVLHDERQYPDLGLARRVFTFRQPISIAAVVEGGPAQRAGLTLNSQMLKLAGKVLQ